MRRRSAAAEAARSPTPLTKNHPKGTGCNRSNQTSNSQTIIMGRPSLMLQRLALLRRQHQSHHRGSTHQHHHDHQPSSLPRGGAGTHPLPTPPSWHHHHHQQQALTTSAQSNSTNDPQGKIGADEDAVAALFDGALGPAAGLNDPRRKRVKDPDADRPKLLTARREALALYREVLRTSNLFVWRDERGQAWRDRIRASARQEFEAARGETDPELVTRMIVTARDALHRAVDQFRERRAAIIEDEARRADAGVVAPVAGGGAEELPSWGQGVPLVRGGASVGGSRSGPGVG
jgi:hypothetical protein